MLLTAALVLCLAQWAGAAKAPMHPSPAAINAPNCRSRLNMDDDYCDCLVDGADETTTSACSGVSRNRCSLLQYRAIV